MNGRWKRGAMEECSDGAVIFHLNKIQKEPSSSSDDDVDDGGRAASCANYEGLRCAGQGDGRVAPLMNGEVSSAWTTEAIRGYSLAHQLAGGSSMKPPPSPLLAIFACGRAHPQHEHPLLVDTGQSIVIASLLVSQCLSVSVPHSIMADGVS